MQQQRKISEIATEIRREWKTVYFGAAPYLSAMSQLDTINDVYGYDSAESIVLYFLANAQTWRGDAARRIKLELKNLVSSKRP
jgi:hypothetical protein